MSNHFSPPPTAPDLGSQHASFLDRAAPYVPIALGALLFLAPMLLGFAGGGAAALSAYAFGAAIAGVGVYTLLRRPNWTGSALLFLGLGAAAVPFALGFAWATSPSWAHVLLGLATAAFGVLGLEWTRRRWR